MVALSVPSVEWNEGASRLKASRGSDGLQVGGGKRGAVKGFSAASRRRLMFTIACVKRGAELPCFVTLTYPNEFPSAQRSKRDIQNFIKRLSRSFPDHGLIWKLEPQDRGAPHYHLLVWGCQLELLQGFVPLAWFEVAGHGDGRHLKFHQGKYPPYRHCVEQVRSFRGVWSYASKYLGKTFEVEGWARAGRYWGIVNRQNIPFGKFSIALLTSDQVSDVIRYQRRFAHLESHHQGMTIFCDADQWIQKLGIEGGLCLPPPDEHSDIIRKSGDDL